MNGFSTNHIAKELRDALCAVYGFERAAIEFVRYSQNYVFRVEHQGRPLVVRVTASDHRTPQEIVSELDWISYLKGRGVAACGAVTIAEREVCETVVLCGREFSCVVFEHAGGRLITGMDLTPALFEQHGKLVGRLHRLTMDYVPSASFGRAEWHESRLYSRDLETYVLPEQPRVAEVLRDLVSRAMALPKRRDNYGLVHLDLHYDNFTLDQTTPCLFDFDNCAHGFFANDVAKALHGSVLTYHRRKRSFDDSPFESPSVDRALAEVWGPFWAGYRSELEPPHDLFEALPLFFLLVDIHDYVHHHRHGTPDRDPRIKAAFRKVQDRIERRALPVQFDFAAGEALDAPVFLC